MNNKLSTFEKFAYLKSYVEKDAAQAIRGFTQSSENYEKALDLLYENVLKTPNFCKYYKGKNQFLPISAKRQKNGKHLRFLPILADFC